MKVPKPKFKCLGCDKRVDEGVVYCTRCVDTQLRTLAKAPPVAREEVLNAESPVDQELAARELARRRLLPFVLRMKETYMASWFHQDLAARLERFSKAIVNGQSPCLIINVPPRHGKLLADETPILTTHGWTTHGQLRPGDYVFGADGCPTQVLRVGEPDMATMRVRFSDGSEVTCHPAHEWTVYDRKSRAFVTVETRWLHEQSAAENRSRFLLPKIPPLGMSPRPYMMPPYVLGAWLGDGTSNRPMIAHDHCEDEVANAIALEGYTVSGVSVDATTGVINTKFSGAMSNRGMMGRMTAELKTLSVFGDKHIPESYKLGSIAQRLELIAGLIDTDGYVEGEKKVRITTVSQRLALDITDVCRSLGWRTAIYTEAPRLSTSGIQGRKTVYSVSFFPDFEIPTRLARKRAGAATGTRRVGLAEVVQLPESEWQQGRCIQVEAPDGLYLAGRHLTPTHNSELASKAFVAWHLGRNPRHQIIAATHSDKLALDNSRDVLEYVTDERYKVLFPETHLKADNKGATGWRTTKGGSYKPVGVGAGIAGYGAHVLIIDDPHRDQDAYSETIRDNILRWRNSSAKTRLMPGGGQLLIQTRWVLDDLTGRVLEDEGRVEEGGKWEVVCYPAVAEEDEYRTPSGRIVYIPDLSTQLLRKKGEALHPARYSLEALNEHRSDAVVWAALYQQNPTAGDAAIFKQDEMSLCELEDIPDNLRYYTTCDFALSTAQRGDFCVLLHCGVDEEDTLWVVDIEHGKWDGLEIAERVIESYIRYQQDIIGIEKNHMEMAIRPFLDKMLEERGIYGLNYEALEHGNRDKVARARPIQARIRQGKVRIPKDASWSAGFIKELLEFPVGRHDDMVDAVAWMGQMLETMIPASAMRSVEADNRRRRELRRRMEPVAPPKRWKMA